MLKSLRADLVTAADFNRVPSDDGTPAEWYAGEVQAGRLHAYGVFSEGARVGTVAVRREGAEMVLVAAQGRVPGGRGVADVLPVIEGLAKGMGCRSMRAHETLPAMVRLMERAGYRQSEIVMRKAI